MRKILLALLVSTTLIACNETVIENDNNCDMKTRAFTSTNFTFDDVTKPEVWKTYNSLEEMEQACQIPEPILSTMSTEDLVKACISYPLYGNYALYNDVKAGINAVMSGFNGFSELRKRQDAGELIIKYLEQHSPVAAYSASISDTELPSLRVGYIKNILKYGQLSITDSIKFQRIIREKEIELAQLPIAVCYDIANDNFDDGVSTLAANDQPTTYYGQTIATTPTRSMTDAEIASLNQYVTSAYPNAIILKTASPTYNCHSYAWNLTDGGDVCWINATIKNANDNISKYWTNDYYGRTTADKAQKVFYYESDHSAVVSNAQGKYISKWGPGPLVRHDPGYGPYSNMDKRYYYKGENCAYGTLTNSETGILTVGGSVTYGISTTKTPFIPKKIPTREEWIVINAKGDDVTNESYIRIEKTVYSTARITFNKAGNYEIYYNIYSLSGNRLIEYSTETYVEL